MAMLRELCRNAHLEIEEVSSCSGFSSQKASALWRVISKSSVVVQFALTLPLRVLPPVLDPLISKLTNWPNYSICLAAYKPRWICQHNRMAKLRIARAALYVCLCSGARKKAGPSRIHISSMVCAPIPP